MPPDLDDLRDMKAAFKRANDDGVIGARVYRDTVLTSWGIRGAFLSLGLFGLMMTTFFAFFFGPELGALMTILCGCTSIFLPQILSERAQKHLFRRVLRQHVLMGSAAASTSFAIPASFTSPEH